TRPVQTSTTTSTPLIPEDPATRKRFIQEKATLLRTRLQTAMRHIHDPQLDRRLSDLEAHSRKYPRLPLPQEQRIMTTPTSSTSSSSQNQNQNQTTPRPYQPTTQLPLHETETQNASGLSSPPLSTGTIATQKEQGQETQTSTQRDRDEYDDDNDPMKTPTQKSTTHHSHTHRRTNTLGSPMQLSSPPATVSRRRSTETGKDMGIVEDDDEEGPQERQRRLSQKGDAVDGLLKLMGTGEGVVSGTGTGVA
ncbi:hypothetical protein AbraIFM66950_001935, partial [Aspergillus brasiliensis]